MRKTLVIFLLPAFLFSYTSFNTMVPMRDGTRLYTLVLLPQRDKIPAPAILIRTPYGTEHMLRKKSGAIKKLLEEGFAVVIQDLRGCHDSEGENRMFFTDGWGSLRDGYDTVEWIARQSWCNGKVGMYGGSAHGIVQYLAAGAVPPHLKATFVINAAWNLYNFIYPGGEFRKHDVEAWVLSNSTPSFLEFLKMNPDYSNQVWGVVNLNNRVSYINIPVFHVGGWYDCFAPAQIEAFHAIEERGGEKAREAQRLIIGPWTHHTTGTVKCGEVDFPQNASARIFQDYALPWFEKYLQGKGGADFPKISLYLMGPLDTEGPWNLWQYFDEWPFDRAGLSVLYPGADGLLHRSPPEEHALSFLYDPENPVPTVGGNNLTLTAGIYDQRKVWDREDVLTFASQPTIWPYAIFGRVKLILYASSSAPDTDFTAKLVDIYPDGRKMLILDSIIMARHRNGPEKEDFLQENRVYRMEIDLGYTAYAMAPGHRLGLAISSSNYPKYEANPNTGEPVNFPTHTQTALNKIYTGKTKLLLPTAALSFFKSR